MQKIRHKVSHLGSFKPKTEYFTFYALTKFHFSVEDFIRLTGTDVDVTKSNCRLQTKVIRIAWKWLHLILSKLKVH